MKIVFSQDHFFSSCSPLISYAVSCKGEGVYCLDGGGGFDHSEKSKEFRQRLISDWYELDGDALRSIENPGEVVFHPKIQHRDRWWKVLCKPIREFNTKSFEDLGKQLSEIAQRYPSDRKSIEMVSEMVQVAINHGANLQYWPYLTEYCSILYLFGGSAEDIFEEFSTFMIKSGIEVVAVPFELIPVH